MCAAALAEVGVGRVVFGASNPKFGGCGSVLSLNAGHTEALMLPPEHHSPWAGIGPAAAAALAG